MQILAVAYSLIINYVSVLAITHFDIDRLIPFGQFLSFPISQILSSIVGISLYKYLHKKAIHPGLSVLYIGGLLFTTPYIMYGFLDFVDGGITVLLGLILIFVVFYIVSSRSSTVLQPTTQDNQQNVTNPRSTASITFDILLLALTVGVCILLFFMMFCGMVGDASRITLGCKAVEVSMMFTPLLAIFIFALISDIIRPFLQDKHRVFFLIFIPLLVIVPIVIMYMEGQGKVYKTKKEFQNYISEVENIKLDDDNPILRDCSIKDVRVIAQPIFVDDRENKIYSKEGEYGLEFSIRFPGVADESDTTTYNLMPKYRYKINPSGIQFNIEELLDKTVQWHRNSSEGRVHTVFDLLTYPNPITAKCSIPPQISNRDAQYYASTVRIHSLVGAKGQELEFSKYINQYFAKDILLIKNIPAE